MQIGKDSVSIVEAEYDDLEKILEIQMAAFQEQAKIYDNIQLPPLQQTMDQIREEFSKKLFLKALIGDTLVGSVRGHMSGNTCHIERLIVLPGHQNSGIGRQLMQAIEEYFKNETDRYEIFTGHKSEKNIALYKKLGYAIFKEEAINDKLSIFYMKKKNPGTG